MKKQKMNQLLLLSAVFIALLFSAGCQRKDAAQEKLTCRLVLEDGEGFRAKEPALSVQKGETAVFSFELEEGYEFQGADYPGSTVTRDETGKLLTLTLPDVQYSETIRIQTQKTGLTITYYANGGQRKDKKDSDSGIPISRSRIHARPNTSIGTDLFERPGYTLTGWNTSPQGDGRSVGLGSRTDWTQGMKLYAQWSPWTEEACFIREKTEDFCVITGYTGDAKTITVPAQLGGLPVRRIQEDAFKGAACRKVILPPGLHEVESHAFCGSTLEELVLYDDLAKISDYAFEDCKNLKTLRIQAIQEPVYSGNYFAAFADKYDRLLELKEEKKIVLFSGSSTRFGYDSARFEEAFPSYQAVNMGVFAYSSVIPQLLLILDCMQEGDILIDSPEFDAASRQFCFQKNLDYASFAMMEANYDMFALADLREMSQVFTAFTAYNTARKDMEKRNYDVSPSYYDEDGNPVSQPSYNKYGDYALYRPDSDDDQPVYGLPVHYTIDAFPEETYIRSFNEMFSRFQEKGVNVYFTYSPRNRYALSPDSTFEERQRLHQYFVEKLCVPVISSLEASLYSGKLLYGTDNHLSTNGAALRTDRVIKDLKAYLEKGF